MKLESGMYVSTFGLTEEIFNAMVAVARESGFELSKQDKHTFPYYKGNYILLSKRYDNLRILDKKYLEGEQISIEDWLFSLAPDWAVDIREDDNGYFYSDNDNRSVTIDGESSHAIDMYKAFLPEPILTRTKPKPEAQWAPKVGEGCEYHCGQQHEKDEWWRGDVITKHDNLWVIKTHEDDKSVSTYDGFLLKCLRPVQPTEEELAINELLEDANSACSDFMDYYMAGHLIDLGWRKVK